MDKVKQEGGKRIRTEAEFKANPTLSVITVVFNGQNHLLQTIESLLAQTYLDYEFIIVDGGSRDRTLDIIKQHEEHIDYWISETDKGIYDAMNKGIELARGAYLFFLNADDYLTSADALDKVMFQLKKGDDGYCGRINFVNGEGNTIYAKGTRQGNLYDYVMHQAFIYKRELHDYMLYNTTYRVNADYDFYLYMLQHQRRFIYGDIVVSNMRIEGTSYHLAFLSAAETLHIHLKNKLPVFRSIFKFQLKIVKITMRNCILLLRLDFIIALTRKTKTR